MIRQISMKSYALNVAYNMLPQYFKKIGTELPCGKTLVSAKNPLVPNLKEFVSTKIIIKTYIAHFIFIHCSLSLYV